MKKLILIFILSSCGTDKLSEDKQPFMVCNCEQNKQRSEWLSENLRNALYMSKDDEAAIQQLQKVSFGLYCEQRWMYFIEKKYKNIPDWSRVKLDSCEQVYL